MIVCLVAGFRGDPTYILSKLFQGFSTNQQKQISHIFARYFYHAMVKVLGAARIEIGYTIFVQEYLSLS